MNKKLIWVFLLSAILFSCKKQIYQLGLIDGKRLKVEEIEFDCFQARSKIKILDGNQSINASAIIRIKNDSIIWISVTPSVGIEIFRAIITPDSVYIIDRLNREYKEFSIDSINNRLNFDLSYTMLESILLGNLVIPRQGNEKVMREGNYYRLRQHDNRFSINNFINSKSMKIEKVSIADDTTSNYLSVDYHDFQDVDSVLFAFNNSISLFYSDNDRSINTQVIITYNKASFSDKKVKFPFNVPERYDSKGN
ncbi:MAG TPA: DUF4292 domain-containing protein [Cyclobacteriaceae bacterium]|nr:DUF4292 domain-containing protein [Cyclobacteriaceae bacterium]